MGSPKTAYDPGFLDIDGAVGMYHKLRNDLNTIHRGQAGASSYTGDCFDFFVTAWHMVDWVCPDGGDTDVRQKKSLKDSPLMRMCGQFANGGKHFVRDPKCLERNRQVCVAYVGVRCVPWSEPGSLVAGQDHVVRVVDHELAAALGCAHDEEIGVKRLAGKVAKFWEQILQSLGVVS